MGWACPLLGSSGGEREQAAILSPAGHRATADVTGGVAPRLSPLEASQARVGKNDRGRGVRARRQALHK